MTDAILEVNGLVRAFGETKALTACSFEAAAGTIHSILGENGSGKSTTVKVLSGVLSPDNGTVTVAGQQVTKFTPGAARRVGVSTVFQELLNVPSRSVLDNVLLGEPGWFRHRLSHRERAEAARRHLGRLGLTDLDLDQQVGGLALSTQQLVAIARSLATEPKVLILDEASSALDVKARDLLFAALREELERGILVLYISHRMEEIVHLADAVTVLHNGATVTSVYGAGINEANLLDLMVSAGVTAHD
jgi:ribose transport system ATP-binding protein